MPDTIITNEDRAKRALDVLEAYGRANDEHADDQTRLIDLLADLMHLARSREDKHPEDGRMDFTDAVRIAEGHFAAEISEHEEG